MTTPPRDRVTRLIVALAVTSAIMTSAIMTSAIVLPRAALAEDGQFDKMRARIAAFVADKMEKLGGSRIVYKVDTDGLRESVVTDLRDDVYKTLREGKIAFSGLAIRDAGVEVKIADVKGREQLARKLASAAEGLPSHALTVTDGGDGLVRLAPTDAASAARLHELVEDSIAMIEQRLKDAGINLASVQPDGTDRIRIFIPGMMEPARVTAVFARKVKVGFRLIDLSMPRGAGAIRHAAHGHRSPARLQGRAPLPGRQGQRARRRRHQLCRPGICQRHERPDRLVPLQRPRHAALCPHHRREHRKALRHRARRKGDLRPRDPRAHHRRLGPDLRQFHPGGSNSVAMLLRAGSLPGHLDLVEQQVVQPAAKP